MADSCGGGHTRVLSVVFGDIGASAFQGQKSAWRLYGMYTYQGM